MATKTVKTTKKVAAPKKEVKEVKEVKKTVKKTDSVKFAVVDVNGQQTFVQEGKEYLFKKLDAEKGKKYTSDKVLLFVDGDKVEIGKPYISKGLVTFDVLAQTKGDKVEVFKYKAKSRYRRTYGATALLTKLLVKKIETKAQ